ncbi:hypothetical protein [Hydrococcus rivularis]|uniref:hypothetical protein n=1 Tax=Hydrococcus rivularis TaxID=1616834 RepID=UPI0015882342|nr:hypothetical protein [Hydrococcus rivularis]
MKDSKDGSVRSREWRSKGRRKGIPSRLSAYATSLGSYIFPISFILCGCTQFAIA